MHFIALWDVVVILNAYVTTMFSAWGAAATALGAPSSPNPKKRSSFSGGTSLQATKNSPKLGWVGGGEEQPFT